jgi:hypothetical protein
VLPTLKSNISSKFEFVSSKLSIGLDGDCSREWPSAVATGGKWDMVRIDSYDPLGVSKCSSMNVSR